MNQLTKITIAWELFKQNVPKNHIAKKLGVTRETVHIWIKGIRENGLIQFLEDYVSAKKGERTKRKADGLLKARIYRLREENRDCCGQKIKEFLEDDYGIEVSTTTIYKILGEKYQLRSKWKHNQVNSRFNHVNLLQTDGGSEFKAEFRSNVFKYADRFRVARPYKKNEQAYIESFNRSLRKECLGWSNYRPTDIPYLETEEESLSLQLKFGVNPQQTQFGICHQLPQA